MYIFIGIKLAQQYLEICINQSPLRKNATQKTMLFIRQNQTNFEIDVR
jgi:hypothetical protein